MKAGCHIDPVTVNILSLYDDLAEVDADTEDDPTIHGSFDVAVLHPSLKFDRPLHRGHDAGELRQQTVAGSADQATMVFGQVGVDQLSAMAVERSARARLVGAYQPRVCDHIG